MNTPRVRWFFDVISPFAYLAFKQLGTLPADMRVEFVPVLFAGLLKHFGQKGPAEIGPKRRFTYQFVVWRAQKLGVPFRMPPAHPFNPLAALRLIIAAGNQRAAIERVFDCVFREGRNVEDPAVIAALAADLGIADWQSTITAPHIKQQLHDNTTLAIQGGVFGVPSLVIGSEVFWGHDALEMAADFWRNPQMFAAPSMAAVDALPLGSVRKQF